MPIVIRTGKCLAVTATEVTVRLRHPPRDIFGLAPLPVRIELRFRLWPETAVTLTLAGKKPGAGWEPQTEELTFAQRPGSDQRPYDRLIGAALDGQHWLFARQDTVEAAWRIVDPVLGYATPVHPYPRGSRGPWKPTGCCPIGTPGTTRRADTAPARGGPKARQQTGGGLSHPGGSLRTRYPLYGRPVGVARAKLRQRARRGGC